MPKGRLNYVPAPLPIPSYGLFQGRMGLHSPLAPVAAVALNYRGDRRIGITHLGTGAQGKEQG